MFIDNGNFILEHEVGMKNGGIDLGFEDQPDTVTFSEGYQDISRRGITQDGYESESSKYAQIAAKKGPNSLYCLGAPLTTYIQSSWKEATMCCGHFHCSQLQGPQESHLSSSH
ncbi:hypothetical protein Bca101_078933 [Brassica carinata]